MEDGAIVTVVAVLVAGVVGPTITVIAAARAQKKRLDHERTLHDLDDLRREVDVLVDAVGDCVRALKTMLETPTTSDAWPKRKQDARMYLGIAYERGARLRLRLAEDGEAVEAIGGVLKAFDAVMQKADTRDKAEIEALGTQIGDANRRFFGAARALVGTQIASTSR